MLTWQLVHITKPDILRHIILLLSLQAVNCYMLRERWGSKGCRCQSIQREPHILKNWLSQNAAGFVWRLRWDWTGWRRSREGRGHQQKELAHAQYWKSAIHSLSTAPLLSLLSFTLTTASDNVRRREKLREWEKEFVQYVCRKTIGWTESGGDHCRTVWQAYKAKSHWTNISSLNWYEMNNKWLINAS